jgi:hypothetical protein
MVKYRHYIAFYLVFLLGFCIAGGIMSITMPGDRQCDCTVKIGNQSLTVEDAFEYVIKGLSAHQWLEVQHAINDSCECCR